MASSCDGAPTCEECDRYEKRIAEISLQAIAFLQKRPAALMDRPHLMIFDVDGTALDDRKGGRNVDGSMKCHIPVRNVYRTAISLGYEVIFLTGRDLHAIAVVRQNLLSEGYNPREIIGRPEHVQGIPNAIGVWKDSVREDLEKRYIIAACIGDQPMDVEGEHVGEAQFRLPDPPIHQQQCVIQ